MKISTKMVDRSGVGGYILHAQVVVTGVPFIRNQKNKLEGVLCYIKIRQYAKL